MAGYSIGGEHYTGMLTRSIVYSGALLVFLAASGLTLASIIVPNWISFYSETNHGTNIHYTYGLSRRCSNTNLPTSISVSSLQCVHFPQYSECRGEDRYFCSMWRSVGFLMSLAVVIEGMTVAVFTILLASGKQMREQGWGVLAILTALAAFIQALGMSLIAYLYDNEERFFVGWFLDKSWVMCTVSWALQGVCALVITAAALGLPTEGGYELILDNA